MKTEVVAVSVLAFVCLASDVLAGAEARKEDLSACKLPHGELVIPDRNTPEGRTGYILRLSDGTLNPSPLKAGERPRSAAEFLAGISAEKAGDLMYSSLNDGAFVAVSGRASDLGEKFLYELSGTSLQRPQPVQSKKERSASGEGTPGAIEGILDGHCYLIEAANGKFALVRVVQKRGRLALIQYVYQPSGKLEFDIPKGDMTTVQPVASAVAPVAPLPPITVPGNVTDVKTLLAVRDQMITKLISIVKGPAKTQPEISAKAEAIAALGRLRASEAADALVRQIDFRDPFAPMSEVSIEGMHPAVGALILIGKPGSLAALAAIEQAQLDGVAEEAKKAKFRLCLLAMVIRGVEGVEVGEFMVKSKMEKAPAKARASYEFVLTNIHELKLP